MRICISTARRRAPAANLGTLPSEPLHRINSLLAWGSCRFSFTGRSSAWIPPWQGPIAPETAEQGGSPAALTIWLQALSCCFSRASATISDSMPPITSSGNAAHRPRVGIPWRTSEEEAQNNRPKIKNYEDAVSQAGGEPVLLPLLDAERLRSLLPTLDGFVLPGSPADVEPTQYGSKNRGLSAPAGPAREKAGRTPPQPPL